MKDREIRERIIGLRDSLDGNLIEIINMLTDLQRDHGSRFDRMEISIDHEQYSYDGDNHLSIDLWGWRKETPAEEKKRLTSDKRCKKDIDARERKEFVRLSKKFNKAKK